MTHFQIRDRDLTIRDRLRPEAVFQPRWRVPCRLRILVVTDSFAGGFGMTLGFHLGQALAIVGADPWSHVVFEFTKAHRATSGEADVIDDFRFDRHDLSRYSQIWLFGIDRETAGTRLTDGELRRIAEFMDAGGGMFATGDHEDLGNQLCARIPRVRNMRRWWHPNPGPGGEPVAPDQSGTGRHDTLVGGGSQTDPVPQEIRPRMYQRTLIQGPVVRQVARFPHPVLCGPNGVLNYLPDHMHEGLCEVPADLGQTVSFDGQDFEEYPDANLARPEVIAWATNTVDDTEFGVLAAYDGHRVDRGRVLVDATWHHWFNINTAPYANASDPAHPSYTPATVAKWAEIQAYFRNVAIWLARPSMQTCIRNGGWLWVLGDYDIAITFRRLERVRDVQLYFWQLGTFARDALGRFASQCQSTHWIITTIFPQRIFEALLPWRDPGERLAIDAELETVALGAAIHGALEAYRGIDDPADLLGEDGDKLGEVMGEAARQGFEAYAKAARARCDALERDIEQLAR